MIKIKTPLEQKKSEIYELGGHLYWQSNGFKESAGKINFNESSEAVESPGIFEVIFMGLVNFTKYQ